MSSSLVGRTLGKYRVIELLGQGGMATVYKGYQEDIDRYVAIKVLPPHPGLDAQFVERFKLEARTVARLQHPHILPLYDYGDDGGVLYLVMAYLEGGTLADLIDRGPMKPLHVEKIVREIASALDYAHRHGVVHRDIKPGNILLDGEGHALLADFGIVKLPESGQNLTGTGMIGTPAYMAPEQAQGTGVDARSDIYSLGVVVYEMLTGQQPFSADTPMQLLIKHMQEPVPSVIAARSDLPPRIDYVLKRALAKDPDARYQSAADFAAEFAGGLRRTGETSAPAASDVVIDLQRPAESKSSTTQLPQATVAPSTDPIQSTGPQTIIVQQPGWHPLALLGGFAIIAVALVVVVLLVVNKSSETPQVVSNPTERTAPTATHAAVAAGPTVTSIPTFGQLAFTTSTKPGDTVQLRLEQLSPLPQGQTYAAWLVDRRDGATMALGSPTLDAFGTGSLTFVDPATRILPTRFNAVIITAETEVGNKPAGEVRYSGSVPWELAAGLGEILIASNAIATPTPAAASSGSDGGYETIAVTDTSLLSGVLAEAKTADQHSGLAAKATNPGALHTHAEHTINILLGTLDDYDGNGRGENPGRKIGLPFYLDAMDALLERATSAPGADLHVQSEAELIRVCTGNVRGWVSDVIALEKELLTATDITAVEPQKTEATRLTTAIIAGTDQNQNGLVEPYEGECGLKQIPTFGVLAASMDIREGPLPES